MTAWDRLEGTFAGRGVDRTPILGGWISCAEHIAALAETSLEEYWKEPLPVTIQAYRALGTDGLIDIIVPKGKDDFRIVDETDYMKSEGMTVEEAVAKIEGMPSGRETEAAFDFEASYEAFKKQLLLRQAMCGNDIVYMPAQWDAAAKITWYSEFGYDTFFTLVGANPHATDKLLEIGGARGHCISRMLARAVQEGIYPHAVLLGEDICSQRGPMVSPEFLSEHWTSPLSHSLRPLVEVGCRPVWHSDGNVAPLVEMLIECGVQGFQGFQPECGVTLESFLGRKADNGDPLLIFGPLSVTTGLPLWSPQETTRQVRQAIAQCRGKARLVMFTANTINPDVPLANIRAMHKAVRNGGADASS